MSSVTSPEKTYLTNLLVQAPANRLGILNYDLSDFEDLLKRHFFTYLLSKPKCKNRLEQIRLLGEILKKESDVNVGKFLKELLDNYVAFCETLGKQKDLKILKNCRAIVARLLGEEIAALPQAPTESLPRKPRISIPSADELRIAPDMHELIEERVHEAEKVYAHGAYLSSIILIGSATEGLLVGVAQRHPKQFREAGESLKKKTLPRDFGEWPFDTLIRAARDGGWLSSGSQISNLQRGYRNYIHLSAQLREKSKPSKKVADLVFAGFEVVLDDLKAAAAKQARDA